MTLAVYKSSAGSGKTTTLVNEYLKIALQNEGNFKKILAITFTNKAANEMKTRVLEVLKILGASESIPAKLSPIVTRLNINKTELTNRSKKLLSLIIHNYDEFYISTIDAFVHRIIRTFASDVKLPQNFEVVIDKDDIVSEIIQMLYSKVGNDIELTRLLTDFVLSETNDEKGYDPTFQLTKFIELHIQEDGFFELNKLSNLSLKDLTDIIQLLRSKIEQHKKKVVDTAQKSIELCRSKNIDISDFKGGKSSGYFKYMEKLCGLKQSLNSIMASPTLNGYVENDDWFAKTLDQGKKDAILSISDNLKEFFYETQQNLREYIYFTLVYSKIYSLGLVNEIRKLFAAYTEESGKVHISEFNKKISNQIAEEPVPFIYERLGRKFSYFLIDEFQDTSILQWQNLLPLIDESLAGGNYNLLVGDAKQAIYRFRNGEVELFASLPNLYTNDRSPIALEREQNIKRNYIPYELSTNWRSHHEIIKFNNDFFSFLLPKLSERNQEIYSDLKQEWPSNDKNGGLVSIDLLEMIEDIDDLKPTRIKEIIDDLLKKGYKPEDICILCRGSKSVVKTAEYLLNNNIDVVSSESLLLTNSPGVRLIIAFIKLLYNPSDRIATVEFLVNFKVYNKLENELDHEYNILKKISSEVKNPVLSRYSQLSDGNSVETYSIYEISEFVVRNYIRRDLPDVFVQFFMDFAFENNIDIESFLKKWETKKEKLFISLPDNNSAVRIMTIHKSKGLEFPVVIVDAEDKNKKSGKTEFWEEAEIGDGKLKAVMLPNNKHLLEIGRETIYENEKSKDELDFLNMIYVAFTRAEKGLFIIGETKNKSEDRLSNYLHQYFEEKGLNSTEQNMLEFGELPSPELEMVNVEVSVSINKSYSTNWTSQISVAPGKELKLPEIIDNKSSREYGNLIHKLLGEIYTIDDIGKTIHKLKSSGVFSDQEIIIVEDIITKTVTNENLKDFFDYSGGKKIKNETELLLAEGNLIRPDKVVNIGNDIIIIDYKTGEEKELDHIQMKQYIRAFIDLGYSYVTAKLVYLEDPIRIIDIRI